jgi:hypothetical protein
MPSDARQEGCRIARGVVSCQRAAGSRRRSVPQRARARQRMALGNLQCLLRMRRLLHEWSASRSKPRNRPSAERPRSARPGNTPTSAASQLPRARVQRLRRADESWFVSLRSVSATQMRNRKCRRIWARRQYVTSPRQLAHLLGQRRPRWRCNASRSSSVSGTVTSVRVSSRRTASGCSRRISASV